MVCGRCSTENREGARFCRSCGDALARRCPSCAAAIEADGRFCDSCGAQVDDTALATPTTTATAVRKTVTVVFCDLGGSTGFGERTDPEVAREVMARYHALLQSVVDDHRGTVAKFMGDGMMALFGVPEVSEDDALRATRAGVAAQRRFAAFATEVLARHGETLTLRVGINTGEVVVGDGDADLVGDTLNVAARLEKACRPGHVLLGEETWRLVRGEIGCTPLGEVAVSGRDGAVGTYEVDDTSTVRVEAAAPFVGRSEEIGRLRAAFDVACTSRTAVLTTVLGAPGVGKTRLSRELAASLPRARAFELRCDRAGGATFAPIAELIREVGLLGDEADADLARASIDALLAGPDTGAGTDTLSGDGSGSGTEADRARVGEVLAGIVGAAPARSVEETFWAVRHLVEAIAAGTPVVVVLDDIQWAEPVLLDLLEHLAEWVRDGPVLLIGLARPELREVRPSFAAPGRRVHDVVVLDGLDGAATETLAAGLLGVGRLPEELVARLPASTEGNPLFVRELVRMLVDDQVIRLDDGEWELTIDADAIDVPPTIQSLLGARVERLPAPEGEVLEMAAVVGAEFSVGALRALAGPGVPVLDLLEGLRRKDLVEPTGAYWGDEPVHRFHHVLIRDAAYRRILKARRAQLHEQVATWSDRASATVLGEHEATVAFHYEQAHRYRDELGAMDERGREVGRRGAELLAAAAQRALDRDDLPAAGALVTRALALAAPTDQLGRAELLLVGCECLLGSGDGSAARPLVEELATVAGDDPLLGAWATCFEAQRVSLVDPDGLADAEREVRQAAATFAAHDDGAGEAKARQVRAGLLARLGRIGEAELELDLALAAARAVDDRRRVTAVLGAGPVAALFGPSPVARAGGRCLDVIRLLRITTASPSVEATSLRCQAVLEALRGRADVARHMLASARETLEDLGLRHGLLETDLFAGMVELIAGDDAAAVGPLRSAFEGLDALGAGADAGRAAALLAGAVLRGGDVDEADRMATASERLAGQDLKTVIAWRIARAEVAAAQGHLDDAVAVAREAVAIASGTDLTLDHADACVALAALLDQAGDAPAAQATHESALALYEAKGASFPAERQRAVRAEIDAPTPSTSATAAGRLDNALTRLLATTVLPGRDIPGGATRTVRGLTPIALRGERLALVRLTTTEPEGTESTSLGVYELGADGRLVPPRHFAEIDIDDAVGDLTRRFAEGEGAAFADMLLEGLELIRATAQWDLDALRACFADGAVVVDRREIGWAETDADGYVEVQRGYAALLEGRLQTVLGQTIHCVGRALYASMLIKGADDAGSTFEWQMHVVMTWDDDTKITRMELFDASDEAAAHARLAELGAPTRSPTSEHETAGASRGPEVANAASRLVLRAFTRTTADTHDDLAAARPLVAEDVVRIDRRRGVSSPPIQGREEFLTTSRAIYGTFDSIDGHTVAVRGERQAMLWLRAATDTGFEVPYLSVFELDDDGLVSRIVTFDENDLPDAFAELDERWAVLRPTPPGPVETAMRRAVLAARAADADEAATGMAPDFVAIDHRPFGFPPATAADVRERMRAALDITPDFQGHGRMRLGGDRAALAVLLCLGTTTEGSRYTWDLYHLVQCDGLGRLRRIEYFPEDRWEDALARFEELRDEADAFVDPEAVTNRAAELTMGLSQAFAARDWAWVEERAAPDVVADDRRRTVSAGLGAGRAHLVGLTQGLAEVGFERITQRPLAVRGERLALLERTFHNAEGFDLDVLVLIEIDGDDRTCRNTLFDPDDLAAALTEIDVRFADLEAAEHPDP